MKNKHSSIAKLLSLSLGLAITGLSGQHARGASQDWDAGAATQDWNTAANWTNDQFPNDASSDATVNTSTGLFPVITADSAFTPRDIRVGTDASNSGRLDHRSGSVSLFNTTTSGGFFMVGRAGATGTYNLADTSGTGGVLTGFAQGSGSLTVGKLFVGGAYFSSAGTGTINVNTSGTINANSTATFSNHGGVSIIVGILGGNGTLNIDSGTVNAAGVVDVATATANNQATQGTLNIGSGGVLNSEGDFRTAFAGSSGAQATVTLSGGTLNVGSTLKRWVRLGHFDNGNSTVTVNSGNLNLNTDSDIRFKTAGGSGTHIINLNGGAITSYSDNKTTANGAGVVDLMNAGSTANNTFNLNGGVLTIREVMTNNDGSTATFNFNGGTLKATGATANFVNLGGASQKAYVKAGGAIINSNGFDVTIPEALLTDAVSTGGGLTKQGTGTLTLSNANTYSGATTVNSGTLAVGASGSISSSTLVDIKDGAEFNTTAQSFTMLAAQTFKFTLNPAGSGSTGLINAASLDITAGVVDFATLGSLDDSAYVIASYTSKTGSAFATVNNLPSGYTIDYGYNSGSQIALVVPEPGTFAMLLGGIGMLSLFRRRRA